MIQLRTIVMEASESLRTSRIHALLQAGISARGCATPLELFNLLSFEGACDAVVAGVDGLGEAGYALIARLRGSATLGIVATGTSLGSESRQRCLQSGADACLPPGGRDDELAAVLMALARRLPLRSAVAERGPEPAPSGQWELRDQGWTLVSPSGAELSLSANERVILRALLAVAGRAVDRAQIGEKLRASGALASAAGTRSIDVIVSRLRRKAELAGIVLPIRTVYGSGYLFVE